MNSEHGARYLYIALSILLAAHACAGDDIRIAKRTDIVTVPFTIEHDRIFIKVELNGKTSCRCIVDTGSEATILNSALVKVDVKLAGLDAFKGEFVGNFDARRAVLDSINIGGHTIKDFPIGVIEHGAGKTLHQVEMLLGLDFLRRQRFTLDFEKSELVIWPAESELPRPAENIERHRLKSFRGASLDDPRMRLVAEVNQKVKATFMIDTAADTPTFVVDKPFDDYGIVFEGQSSGLMALNDNGKREQVNYYNVSLRFDFDKASFANVKSRVFDIRTIKSAITRRSMHNYYNIIGLPFLKTLAAVHFDHAANVIYFDRRK